MPVRERTLTEGDQETAEATSRYRGAVGDTDPGAHAEAVGEFPTRAHVAEEYDQGKWKIQPKVDRDRRLYSHSSRLAASQIG